MVESLARCEEGQISPDGVAKLLQETNNRLHQSGVENPDLMGTGAAVVGMLAGEGGLFAFNVGDKLDDFSQVRYNPDSISTLDVHGNQYGLLTSSKCFINSQMDCSSCHNVHENEAGNTAMFSQKCIACHTTTTHASLALPADKKEIFNSNCTDCHMPMLPSKKIILDVGNAGKAVPDLVRTHRISIYPQETKIFLQKIKK